MLSLIGGLISLTGSSKRGRFSPSGLSAPYGDLIFTIALGDFSKSYKSLAPRGSADDLEPWL
jgi:hypothetical protein